MTTGALVSEILSNVFRKCSKTISPQSLLFLGLLTPIEVCEAGLLSVEGCWFFPNVIFRLMSALPVLTCIDRWKWKVTHHSSAVWSLNSFRTPEWIPFDPWDLLLLVLPIYSAATSSYFSIWSDFPLLMVFYIGCLLVLQSLVKASDMLKFFLSRYRISTSGIAFFIIPIWLVLWC